MTTDEGTETMTSQMTTTALVARLREIREQAGAAWGRGFVDEEAAGIIDELKSRDTDAARAGLELAAELE